MIRADLPAGAALAARLAARARALVHAHIARRRTAGPLRWRNARLLWPLFTGDM